MEQLFFPVTRREAERSGIEYSQEANKKAGFPSRLRELRKEKGVSQDTVSKELKISKSTLGLWETGDTLPDAKAVYDLAIYYGVSTDFLLGKTNVSSSDTKIRDVCEYTGLSSNAIQALLCEKQKKRTNIYSVIDYLIRDCWLSVLAQYLKKFVMDTVIAEVALKEKAGDIFFIDKAFNKWQFLHACEQIYDDFLKECPRPTTEEITKEYSKRLLAREQEISNQLQKIQEFKNR